MMGPNLAAKYLKLLKAAITLSSTVFFSSCNPSEDSNKKSERSERPSSGTSDQKTSESTLVSGFDRSGVQKSCHRPQPDSAKSCTAEWSELYELEQNFSQACVNASGESTDCSEGCKKSFICSKSLAASELLPPSLPSPPTQGELVQGFDREGAKKSCPSPKAAAGLPQCTKEWSEEYEQERLFSKACLRAKAVSTDCSNGCSKAFICSVNVNFSDGKGDQDRGDEPQLIYGYDINGNKSSCLYSPKLQPCIDDRFDADMWSAREFANACRAASGKAIDCSKGCEFEFICTKNLK